MIIFLGNTETLALYKPLIEDSRKDKKDIVVSCQYPHRIPDSLLKSHVCVNIHYGILPDYAGCNPVYWQIKHGGECGVTLHYIDSDFDSGDIIAMFRAPIGTLTADRMHTLLAIQGEKLFRKMYRSIVDGTAPRVAQDLRRRRYYRKEDVNFDRAKHCSLDRDIRAVHFEGKQLPIIEIEGVNYEVRRV